MASHDLLGPAERRRRAIRAPLLAVLACSAQAPAPPETGPVTHVRIDTELDVGTQALLRRAIARAAGDGDVLVIELDTPGGEVELMWRMANALLGASDEGVRTVAWVDDRALSAGALIALACDELYMRSHATIGSATPVTIGPMGLAPVSEDPDVKEKNYSHLRAEFRGIATRKGRAGVLAEAMVDPKVEVRLVLVDGERKLVSSAEWNDLRQRGAEVQFLRTIVDEETLLNLSGAEAVELQLADGLRESFAELLAKMGGDPADVVHLERSGAETVASFLYLIGPLLLVAGLVLAYLELKAPGFGLPGILAIACFAVLLFGRYLVGLADVPDLILITVGVALVAVEVFLLPGTVWIGLLGAACVVGGMIWSFAAAGSGFEYDLDQRILLEQAFAVLGSALLALVVVWGVARLLPRTPFYARLAVGPVAGETAFAGAMPEARDAHARLARAGATGRALTVLRPVGKVVLDADESLEFEARSEGPGIPAGARVRVVEAQASGRLVVEAIPPADPDPDRR
ncbi:MAG: hypothetical protein AB1726_03325 [Planctomycetota bacterium]